MESEITEGMRGLTGQTLETRVSFPIGHNDIRRWAIASYYPRTPRVRYFGTDGRLVSFGGQFRSPALRRDTTTCRATVTEVSQADDGSTRVSLELAATNQRDDALMPGRADVELS